MTDSSESPSAVCPASTQVPVVQLKTNRSRSAAGSDGLPIVARSDVDPAVTVTSVLLLRVVRDRRRRQLALPSVVPTARPVKAPNTFVSVYERATGTPIVADGITSGFGETVAPRIDAVSVNGCRRPTSDVAAPRP